MVEVAHRLFRRQGYERTGFSEVLQESGAARGAIYHHFPGGKEELALAVIERSNREITERVFDTTASATRPSVALRRYVEDTITNLEASGYEAGCPLAPLVLEAASWSPVLRDATRDAFDDWSSAIVDLLRARGVPLGRARRLAAVLIAAIEGAMLLARTYERPDALRAVVAELGPVLDAAAEAP